MTDFNVTTIQGHRDMDQLARNLANESYLKFSKSEHHTNKPDKLWHNWVYRVKASPDTREFNPQFKELLKTLFPKSNPYTKLLNYTIHEWYQAFKAAGEQGMPVTIEQGEQPQKMEVVVAKPEESKPLLEAKPIDVSITQKIGEQAASMDYSDFVVWFTSAVILKMGSAYAAELMVKAGVKDNDLQAFYRISRHVYNENNPLPAPVQEPVQEPAPTPPSEPAAAPTEPEPEPKRTTDYEQPTTKRQHFETIVALVKQKGTNRSAYTKEELELIATYEGKGGMAKHGATGTGLLSEFFTPDRIVQAMWVIARKNGVRADARMLEPACGIGRFFKYHNPKLIDAYEIDEVNYTIAKVLYPEANITFGSFEQRFFTGTFHRPSNAVPMYDLVIGNPPYESYQSFYSPKEQPATGASTFDQYFLARGLDLLLPGGLLVFIIPSSFLRNDNKYNDFKEKIAEKAELLPDTFRLPNDVFPNTYVGTDIVVFRKK